MGEIVEKPEQWIDYTVDKELGEITRLNIQRFAVSVGDHNPLYFDDQYARAHGYEGIIAPPNFLTAILGWEAGPREEDLILDGTPQGDNMVPLLPGASLMGGGQELELVNPVRPGYIVKVQKKVADIRERDSKSGKLCFLTTESTYTNQYGQVLVKLRDTLIAAKW